MRLPRQIWETGEMAGKLPELERFFGPCPMLDLINHFAVVPVVSAPKVEWF
jgi:hypothetical protein